MLELSRVVVRVAGEYRTLITILGSAPLRFVPAEGNSVHRQNPPLDVVPPDLPLHANFFGAHLTDKSAEKTTPTRRP
jgi:hypothetical protein